jgi:hypothetical protein
MLGQWRANPAQKPPQSEDDELDEQSLEPVSDEVVTIIVSSVSGDPDVPYPRRGVVSFAILLWVFLLFSMPPSFPSGIPTERHLRRI